MKYLKLGEKATQFYDPKTGLHILKGDVKEVEDSVLSSEKVASAIKGGHIQKVGEFEFQQAKKKKLTQPISKGDDVDIKKLEKELSSKNETIDKQELELENLRKEIEALKAAKKTIEEMGDDELVEYLKENFEVEAKDIKDFKKLNTEEKRAYLKDIQSAGTDTQEGAE